MANDPKRSRKAKWLLENLFTSLNNQNDGYDVIDIRHFNADDFLELLIRVQSYNGLAGIWGIESFESKTGYFFDVRTTPRGKSPADVNWYTEAFFALLAGKSDETELYFTATFWIAEELL